MKPISLLNTYTSPFSNCNKQLFLLNKPGAPNDRFRGNICSEASRMAKIFGSPRTAKIFENVSW